MSDQGLNSGVEDEEKFVGFVRQEGLSAGGQADNQPDEPSRRARAGDGI